MIQPLIAGFTTDEDRSKVFGNTNFLFYLSGSAALIMVTILLKYDNSLRALCAIIILGACMGVFSSKFIRNLCETELLRETARKPILPEWKEIKKNPLIRQILFAGFTCDVFLY